MPKATWNGAVIAESDEFETVEGHVYFPRAAINKEYFLASDTKTDCPWKGTASYLTVNVNGEKNIDAAWYYSNPKPAARNITDHVAFWRGVSVEI